MVPIDTNMTEIKFTLMLAQYHFKHYMLYCFAGDLAFVIILCVNARALVGPEQLLK